MNRSQQQNEFRPRAAVSVSDMARAVNLSRSQFYTYVKRGVFPKPIYSLTTKRPQYLLEAQQEILEVRTTGIGSNGEYVMFYERHACGAVPAHQPRRERPSPVAVMHSEVLDGLQGLGMTGMKVADVEKALGLLFPGGIAGKEATDLLPVVYRHFRRQGRA
ncbi:MAG: hypothetical protein WCI73_17705 [Phycisphaerae bacterium]